MSAARAGGGSGSRGRGTSAGGGGGSMKEVFARLRRNRQIVEASFAGARPAATAAAIQRLLVQGPKTLEEEEAALQALTASISPPPSPAAPSPQSQQQEQQQQAAAAPGPQQALEQEGSDPSPLLMPPPPPPQQKTGNGEGVGADVNPAPAAQEEEVPPPPPPPPPETPATLAEMGPIWMMQWGEAMSARRVGEWRKRLKAHGGSVDSTFRVGRTRLAVVPADAPGSRILEAMNISSSSNSSAATSSSSPSRKRARLISDEHSSTLKFLPGLRAVVTHRWLEAFAAKTLAAAQQAQGGRGSKGTGRAPKVDGGAAAVVEVPALAEYVWEDPEAAAAAAAAEAAKAKRAGGARGKQQGLLRGGWACMESGAAGLVNPNEHLTRHFDELVAIYDMLGPQQQFRRRNYEILSRLLRLWPERIDGRDALKSFCERFKSRGVGKKVVADLEHILDYDLLPRLDDLKRAPGVEAQLAFKKIWGVGPKTAQTLYEREGITSISELRARVRQQPSLLNENQRIGLKYYEELQLRIPRAEAQMIEKRVREAAEDLAPGTFTMTTCGSYRRGAATCGDVDILFAPAEGRDSVGGLIWQLVRKLEDECFLTDHLTGTRFNSKAELSESYMGVCWLGPGYPHRRIDLKAYPREQFPFAVLYFTGSDYFNRSMRCYAIQRKGWSLSDKGMGPALWNNRSIKVADVGERIHCKDEREIFEKLGLVYKAPEERNTHDAVEMHGGGGGAAVTIEELDALVVREEEGDLYVELSGAGAAQGGGYRDDDEEEAHGGGGGAGKGKAKHVRVGL